MPHHNMIALPRIGYLSLLLAAAIPTIASAGITAPEDPSVDHIDYDAPEKYLAIKDTLGTDSRISSLAADLRNDGSDLVTIQNVLDWMDQNLEYKGDAAYAWRNFDTVLDEQCYGGCADQGIFCGVLLKAAGIPTIWVKTMDVAWIHAFKENRSFSAWSGHVFLEVYVEGQWALLDPGGRMLYQDYSPQARILPGNRFAYHKGDDPKAMIMSLQWEEWKEQTTEYFSKLEDSLLPVDTATGTFLVANQAFVAGNSPYYEKLTSLAHENGFRVRYSFNGDYDRFLPMAKGHLFLVETHNGQPVVPLGFLEKYFPHSLDGLDHPNGTITLEDGTTVVFFDVDDPASRLVITAKN